MPDMQPVESSSISAIGYDDSTQTLTIEFKNGGAHQYHDVPAEAHEELMAAKSVGGYFHANIRDVFKSTKVEE